MDKNFEYEAAFLEDVAEQIAYKPLRPAIVSELKGHMEDRAQDYMTEGLAPEEARKKAVDSMGDAVAIGAELNALRRVRTCRPLVVLTVILMMVGFAATAFLSWSPEQTANGILYYLPGAAFLIIISLKGYPWLVKYQNVFLITAIAAGLSAAVLYQLWTWLLNRGVYISVPWHMIQYYEILLLGPILVIALYRVRRNAKRVLLVCAFTVGAFLLYFAAAGYSAPGHFLLGKSAAAVCLLSMAGTLVYMIYLDFFSGSRPKLYLLAILGSAAAIAAYGLLPGQSYYLNMFIRPETVAKEQWDDAYNSVLMKELLARTPLTGGISLTPKEMMEYGTGLWYFDKDNVIMNSGQPGEYEEIEEKRQRLMDEDILPWIIHYNESNVTLFDILPQHYHNNYLIALTILLFGWLPGVLLSGVIGAFYWLLFACIRQIHGKLAGAVSFYCGLCLLFQTALYVLGNFGYQFREFTNLPLISEGRISILVNMLLLGFIISAYRYDRVVDDCRYEAKKQGLPC